jgi:hypothetical protein
VQIPDGDNEGGGGGGGTSSSSSGSSRLVVVIFRAILRSSAIFTTVRTRSCIDPHKSSPHPHTMLP